jgi:uncharacterized membrane protein
VKAAIRRTGRLISAIFFQGLAITLPIVLTFALLYWMAASAEAFLGWLIQLLFPGAEYWTGLGILVTVTLVFLAGLLMRTWVTRRAMQGLEALLERIPLVKTIYGGIRDVSNLFSKTDAKSGFRKVVAVRVTDQIRLVGFLTLDETAASPFPADANDPLVGVYLPMSYQIGGYTAFLPKSLVEPLDMSAESAMRFTLTAGMSGTKADEKGVPIAPSSRHPRAGSRR